MKSKVEILLCQKRMIMWKTILILKSLILLKKSIFKVLILLQLNLSTNLLCKKLNLVLLNLERVLTKSNNTKLKSILSLIPRILIFKKDQKLLKRRWLREYNLKSNSNTLLSNKFHLININMKFIRCNNLLNNVLTIHAHKHVSKEQLNSNNNRFHSVPFMETRIMNSQNSCIC